MLNKFIKTKIIFTTNSTANTVGEFAPRRNYEKYTRAYLFFLELGLVSPCTDVSAVFVFLGEESSVGIHHLLIHEACLNCSCQGT